MHDQPVKGEGAKDIAPSHPPASAVAKPRRRFGLSGRLFALTVLFVTATEVFIYVPSLTSFRINWLTDRMAIADAASVVMAGATLSEVPRNVQDGVLNAVGAIAIAVRTGTVSRLIATVDSPPEVDTVVDLNHPDPIAEAGQAIATLFRTTPRTLRVIGTSRSGAQLELLIDDRALRVAMLRYSFNIAWIAALVSVITAALLFFSINRLFVRPMRRLTNAMVAFSAAPEDAERIIEPSGRTDEIGVAEEHLATMQQALQGTLREQRHLADLGLAVSKINHDLRNMLASAQLFSDRLGSLPDPNVQRFAPKLIAALDRAIAYCQSTLAYGRAREPAPARRILLLGRLVDEVAENLGLVGHATITFENRVPADLEIDADPEQLFRVLVNLSRNAMQALESDQDPAVVRRLTISASRDDGAVRIMVADTGPGVPAQARAHLFRAFQGSLRPGGIGLGLAIAAELVRAHRGTIELLENNSPGATFVIVVPDHRSPSRKAT